MISIKRILDRGGTSVLVFDAVPDFFNLLVG
jgi:hypothetical protein